MDFGSTTFAEVAFAEDSSAIYAGNWCGDVGVGPPRFTGTVGIGPPRYEGTVGTGGCCES